MLALSVLTVLFLTERFTASLRGRRVRGRRRLAVPSISKEVEADAYAFVHSSVGVGCRRCFGGGGDLSAADHDDGAPAPRERPLITLRRAARTAPVTESRHVEHHQQAPSSGGRPEERGAVRPTRRLGFSQARTRASYFAHSATPVVCTVSVRQCPRSGLVSQMSARQCACAVGCARLSAPSP
jgi:hypothetical protein